MLQHGKIGLVNSGQNEKFRYFLYFQIDEKIILPNLFLDYDHS